jgi:hypothetical protein
VKYNYCGKKIMQAVVCSSIFEKGDAETERDKEKIGREMMATI